MIRQTNNLKPINIAVFSNENNHEYGDKKAKGNNQSYIQQQLDKFAQQKGIKTNIFPLTHANTCKDIDYAVVRCATQECCNDLIQIHQKKPLKSIFIIGAGVNDFVSLVKQNPKLKEILKDIPVIRNDNNDIAEDMADYVLQHSMNIYRDANYYQQKAKMQEWKPLELKNKSDFTIGIMGAGNLGLSSARKLTLNGFRVQLWSRTEKNIEDIKCFNGDKDLGKFLSSTKILVNLLPLTDQTTGILNKELFEQLPKHSVIMNVARGAHLNLDDTIDALNTGNLDLAILDVMTPEPPAKNSPLWVHEKIINTQHTAAKTRIDNACENHIQKIKDLQKGKRISGSVDLEQGY